MRGPSTHPPALACLSPLLWRSVVNATLLGGLLVARPAVSTDVALLLSADVPAYRDAVRGFEDSSGCQIVVRDDMRGRDLDRGEEILHRFQSGERPDMVLAVGVWALEAVQKYPPDVPVVYAMVLNPPSVVTDPESNVTGASMNVPAATVLDAVKDLGPEVRRIGVLSNPANTRFLVEEAREAAAERGLEIVVEEVTGATDALSALQRLGDEGVDLLWVLPDQDILAERVMNRIYLFSYRQKVPLLGLSASQAEKGALLSVSFASSEDIGRQAGELARRVAAGEDAREIPFARVRKTTLVVNQRAAKKLKFEVPDNLVARADRVIR